MKIKTLFFGITRDIVKNSTIEFELADDTTINKLQKILFEKYSGLTDIKNYAFAVNEEYVNADYLIKVGDVVAVIPPVSGG